MQRQANVGEADSNSGMPFWKCPGYFCSVGYVEIRIATLHINFNYCTLEKTVIILLIKWSGDPHQKLLPNEPISLILQDNTKYVFFLIDEKYK